MTASADGRSPPAVADLFGAAPGSPEAPVASASAEPTPESTSEACEKPVVVLRPVEPAGGDATGAGPGVVLHGVTVDAGEAETFGDTVADLVEALPMPPGLLARTAAFVAQHHVEQPFHKRRRDRADPEALGRRRPEERR